MLGNDSLKIIIPCLPLQLRSLHNPDRQSACNGYIVPIDSKTMSKPFDFEIAVDIEFFSEIHCNDSEW